MGSHQRRALRCKAGSDFNYSWVNCGVTTDSHQEKCTGGGKPNELSARGAAFAGPLDWKGNWIVSRDRVLDRKPESPGGSGVGLEQRSAVHCHGCVRDVLVATKSPCLFPHRLLLLHCHTSCSLARSLTPDFSLPLPLEPIITSNESAVGNISTGSHFGLVATCVGNGCVWMFFPAKVTHGLVFKVDLEKYLMTVLLLLQIDDAFASSLTLSGERKSIIYFSYINAFRVLDISASGLNLKVSCKTLCGWKI